MSSYKRIPKAIIKLSENKMAFNDEYKTDEESFKKTTVEEYIEESKRKVKKEEQRMLQEIEEKRETLIERAREEGRERALSEAEEILRKEYTEILEEANDIYEKANAHYVKMMEESEIMKENFLHEKKEEIVDFLLFSVEKIINQAVELDKVEMEKLYDRAISQVKYDTKKIYVRVHPDTYTVLSNYKNAQMDKRIEFLFDLSVNKTDFIIETDREFIDLSIETQLDEMKDYLRGVFDAEH